MRTAVLSLAVIVLFVGDSFAVSVIASKPPIKCGPYEVYSTCGCNMCQNTCAYPNASKNCKPACRPGCICVDGYLRNSKKICVKPEKCDTCKENEVFTKCDNHPCHNTCAEPDLITRCSYVAGCYAGCICKPGYLRNEKGDCVLASTCVNQCEGPNEVAVRCKDFCPLTCRSITSTNPLPICMIRACQPGCNCADGYVRNNRNICVKADQCRCEDPNAEVVSCPNPCPGGNCESPKFAPCKAPCKIYGCQCKKGYVKDANGKCILLSQCPKKCKGPNEIFVPCKDPCPASCYGITSDKPQPQCLPPYPCPGGYNCLPGYVRNDSNICVKAESCTCNDPNAEVVSCPNPCPGGTCESPEFSQCKIFCKPFGCQCKKGYVKNSDGKCILLSECPSKCKENERWNPCAGYCTFDRTCSMIIDGILPSCPAPPIDFVCGGRCECLEGYVRTNDGCQPESICCPDPNSEIADCPIPCHETCFSTPPPTCELDRCIIKGCKCKNGYVKGANDTCILREQCPCEDPKAELVNCKK